MILSNLWWRSGDKLIGSNVISLRCRQVGSYFWAVEHEAKASSHLGGTHPVRVLILLLPEQDRLSSNVLLSRLQQHSFLSCKFNPTVNKVAYKRTLGQWYRWKATQRWATYLRSNKPIGTVLHWSPVDISRAPLQVPLWDCETYSTWSLSWKQRRLPSSPAIQGDG